MRILYHHRTLADGAEGVHIAAMVAAFRKLGHDVRLDGLTNRPEHATERQLVERLRSALPAGGYELAGVAYNALEYLRLVAQMRRFRPDVIYTRHSRCGVAALVAARTLRIPSILEINALFGDPGYRQFEALALPGLVRLLERQAAAAASVVIAVSSPLATRVRSLANANVLVVPNGADPAAFDPERVQGTAVRAKYGLADRLTIGWAGILREWHGVELLIDAVVQVPSATLLLVGDGPARAALEQRVRLMGITDRVVITGRVQHDQMPQHIAAMDIAVVAREGTGVASPMKMLEYMAMERAVVAPKALNIEDVIVDGLNGVLFAPGQTNELVIRLQKLANDESMRRRLGVSARADIISTYNWQKIAQRVLAAI